MTKKLILYYFYLFEHVPASDLTKTLEMDHNWWKPLLSNKDLERVHPYSKFLMMFSILKECEEIGDKVLVYLFIM